MKYQTFIICLCLSAISYSQTGFDEYKDFDFYAKPSVSNKLSKYFREHVNLDLVKAVKFRDTASKKIVLRFKINDKGKPRAIHVNSNYSELNRQIIDAFKKYEIDELQLPKTSSLYTYKIQIISMVNKSPSINCSTHVIYDKRPVYSGCDSVSSESKLSSCNYKKLNNHVLNNIDLAIVEESRILGELFLSPKFKIDSMGNVVDIKCKGPNESLSEELNRVIRLLPKVKSPAMRNGNPVSYYENSGISLVIEPKTNDYLEEVKSKDSILNKDHELALYFKEHINSDVLNDMSIPDRQKTIRVFFNLSKKGKYLNVRNNLRSKTLSLKINDLLKKFPVKNLNLEKIDVLSTYSYVIAHKNYDKFEFQSENKPNVERLPIFESCENAKNFNDLRKCNHEKIMFHVKRQFDRSVRSKTRLEGNLKMNSTFKIDSTGQITNVKTISPNPYFSNEMERVLRNLSFKIKPSYKNGKPADFRYAIPIYYILKAQNFRNKIIIRK